jgi:hypothetical protein
MPEEQEPKLVGSNRVYWIAGIISAVLVVPIGGLVYFGVQVIGDWTALHNNPIEAQGKKTESQIDPTEGKKEAELPVVSTGAKPKFDASLAIFQAIVGGFGTIATIGAGIVLYLNFRVANKNAEIANRNVEIANKTLELTGSRLITERFSKAVEQLGSDKLEVRLGGIYSLERIAYDSDRDHWTIMEVLTSFIQEKSSTKQLTDEKISAQAYEIWQKGSKDATDEENWESAMGAALLR